MSFFNSEFVRSELAEISELQEDIYTNIFKFPSMSKEDKLYHVGILQKLLEKQQVLYTRLSLSDDPEAVQMKENIIQSAQMMGFPPNTDISVLFNNMSQTIELMKEQIDKLGSDVL